MSRIWTPQPIEVYRSWVDTITSEASDKLNDWETDFVNDMDDRLSMMRNLTEGQAEKLESIYWFSLREPTSCPPIAVLCYKISEGFEYMLECLRDNVAEYSTHKRRIIDKTGEEYVIINSVNQLLGWEIKDFRITPGFGMNPDAEIIRIEAQHRIR